MFALAKGPFIIYARGWAGKNWGPAMREQEMSGQLEQGGGLIRKFAFSRRELSGFLLSCSEAKQLSKPLRQETICCGFFYNSEMEINELK